MEPIEMEFRSSSKTQICSFHLPLVSLSLKRSPTCHHQRCLDNYLQVFLRRALLFKQELPLSVWQLSSSPKLDSWGTWVAQCSSLWLCTSLCRWLSTWRFTTSQFHQMLRSTSNSSLRLLNSNSSVQSPSFRCSYLILRWSNSPQTSWWLACNSTCLWVLFSYSLPS